MNRKLKTALLVSIVAVVGMGIAWRFAFRAVAAELDQSIDGGKTRVEVSFDYVRQGGRASNQLAVWITDGDGKHVKTLCATNFTAGRGGWQSRKDSLSSWVANSGIAGMDKAQIDAVSCATPPSGAIRMAWYCDDANGRPVPAGAYTVNVEGSLRWENRVLYKTVVQLYENGTEAKPAPEFSGPSTEERAMLTNVLVRFVPL